MNIYRIPCNLLAVSVFRLNAQLRLEQAWPVEVNEGYSRRCSWTRNRAIIDGFWALAEKGGSARKLDLSQQSA